MEVWEILDMIIFMVLRSCVRCQLYCSSCGHYFYPKAFPEEDKQQGDCSFLLKVSKTFRSPLLSKFEGRSCQYDYPARCIWLTCSSLRNRHPGAVPALGIVTHGPRFQMSMSYLLMASKHSREQETLTDGWNAFKKTPPDSLGDAKSPVGGDGF